MSRAPIDPPALAGFTFIRLLGRGGFADVFLYEQHLPKRQVAIKVLLTEALTEQSREQFAREANLMAALAHPNIVSIYQAAVADDGRPYFVMEYCPGASLSTRYKESPFSVEEALRDGVRLAGAVATAHAAGILHRDIKPANVLTNSYGAPALTDFGISVSDGSLLSGAAVPAESTEMTSTSTVGLSVPWSPPELFTHDSADVRSDVYSLGATVFTLLAGRSPYELAGKGNTPKALIARITSGTLAPLDREDVPAALLSVLRKSMSADPAERYQKASDFARALQGVELELGFHPTPVDLPQARVERAGIETIIEGEETRIALPVAAAGITPASAATSGSVAAAVQRPRGRLRKRLIVLGAIVAVVSAATVLGALNLSKIMDQIALSQFTADPEVATIASKLDLTTAGELLMALNPPQLLPEGDYDVVCPSPVAGVGTVSCTANGRITLYDVKDDRFDGIEEVALAHQLLHAAWLRMTPEERTALTKELTSTPGTSGVDGFPGIGFGVKHERAEKIAETYAVLGTQATTVSAALEESYAEFFGNRAAIVEMHVASLAIIGESADTADALQRQIDGENESLSADYTVVSAQADQLNADYDAFFAKNDAFGFGSQEEFDAASNELSARGDAVNAQYYALDVRSSDVVALGEKHDELLAELDALYGEINIEQPSSAGLS